MAFVRIPPENRYWNHVEVRAPDECWPWMSKRNRGGYGMMSIDGKQRSARRWAYRYYIGPLEDKEVVRHTCDHPWCHNHSHWIKGTQADNIRDMDSRGRRVRPSMPKGEASPRAKLTEIQAREIISRRREGALLKELAPEYGVSMRTISLITRGERWGHLT